MALSAAEMAVMSRLLDEALPLGEAGRRRWLESLPPEHAELATALRYALLQIGEEGSGLGQFATPPKIGAGDETVPGSGLQPSERVGPYELIRLLGAGGMAEVWLAQRADGAFKREVALKLPMLTRLRKDLASRFARERDILAALEHPNIARLYDAGVSSDGLPYLAMEYVPGEPLTAWCDAHRLGIRERLKLFRQVLDAVQDAHGHQVIHRDIKPSNILVTESGQVRLLDFGVAKLLAEEDEHTQLTQIYGRALTPDYASPELVRGEPIDAAADVYSLGVVLYELLSGSRPYHLTARASVALLEQAIATAQVQRPSTQVGQDAGAARATSQQKLARRLRGDLDAIVLRALAKAPADRYGSVEALADDVQRYLSGEPVEARPAKPTYLIGKFVQRNRTGVATATAVAVLIAAMIGYELMRAPVVEHPTAATVAAPAQNAAPMITVSDKSIAVLPFVDMSEKHDQEYFADGMAEEILDLLSRVPELHVPARTSSFYFKGRQATIADIAKSLNVAHVLEGSVRKSGNTLRVTVQLVRADNAYHLWSETYDRRLDDIFKIQDEIAGAVVQALKVSLLETSLPRTTATQSTEAYTLYLQARSIYLHGFTQADSEKVVAYLQRALRLDPTFAPGWALLSRAHSFLAQAYIHTPQEWDEARRAAGQALALDPRLPDAHSAMARIQFVYEWDWAGAQAQLQQALALDPSSAWALTQAGSVALVLGHTDQALELVQRSVASDPINSSRYFDLSSTSYIAGRLDEALVAIRKSLDLNPTATHTHHLLGLVILAKGDPKAALAEMDREGDEAARLQGRALAYHALRRSGDADVAVADLEKMYSEKNAYGIAEVHAYRGEVDQAFTWLDRAVRQRDSHLPFHLRGDPLLKNLRPDSRYKAFLRKINLPE